MILDFNMSRDYCSDWTALEAIREIAQNAIDTRAVAMYQADDYNISIITAGISLKPEHFTVGVSQKGFNAIGQYGEGFKIAMLVLTRLGLNPVIKTGNMVVTGTFSNHEFTGVETFCMHIETQDYYEDRVDFQCMTGDTDLVELARKITVFAAKPLGIVTNVVVLEDRPGAVYVNGLHVCDKSLTHGYNFPPAMVTLNRDRNMTEGETYHIGKYYAACGEGKASLIFQLIEANANDVSCLGYFTLNSKLAAELTRLFYNKYGDGAEISKAGGMYCGSGVSYGSSGYNVMQSAGVKEKVQMLDPKSPTGVITEFFENNKKKMRRDIKVNFSKMLEQSKGWKK